MGWLALALLASAIAGSIAMTLRRRTQRASAEALVDAASAQPKRPDTALAELREMRDALAPATHSRVERRRSPGAGAPKIERRRKGTRRASQEPGRPDPGTEPGRE